MDMNKKSLSEMEVSFVFLTKRTYHNGQLIYLQINAKKCNEN